MNPGGEPPKPLSLFTNQVNPTNIKLQKDKTFQNKKSIPEDAL
jgi:hypothetical protein